MSDLGKVPSQAGADDRSGLPPLTGMPPRYTGSQRPAWQPMTVPRPSGSRGVTVFGTTLTRRQTVIGAVLLLVLLLTLVFALPLAFAGDDDGDPGAAPTPAATGPAKPGTTGATTAPTTSAAPAAPAVPAPATTSAPPPKSEPPAAALPNGWYLYKDPTGFSVPLPKGWSVMRKGTEVYFQDNTRRGRLLIVDQTRQPKSDPVADWTAQERARRGSYSNYNLLGIRKVDYWKGAADWEFTRTSDNGNPLHVVKRGFITASDQAYGISWSTSADDWDANKGALKTIYDGFVPARS